jgi:reticulon-4-interacting protein 1, mitochondrial
MRAWTHTAAGNPSKVLNLAPSLVTPTLKSPSDVLVRITHASLSPGGSIMMQLCPSVLRAKPSIPELDFSGIVVDVGSDVPASRELRAGVAVFGSVLVGPHVNAGIGALAEYIALPATSVVRKPENVSLEKAAGFGVSGCTALALMNSAKIQKGDKVLVNGASGGVGSIVVQFAKEAVGEAGRVVAICSGGNVEMVKEIGADEVCISESTEPSLFIIIHLLM